MTPIDPDGSDDDTDNRDQHPERRKLTKKASDRSMIAALASTGLVAAFMQTLVTPIVPKLPALLDTTPADATWVLTTTLLAAAIFTPISGRLGDMYGKRRILLALILLMLAGSVVAALSTTLIPMIAGRALQGIGLGVIALGISILRDIIHPRNLGGAIALVSATLGIGGAVGLPISAVIAQNLDFHFLFWLAALLSLSAFIFVFAVIPVSTLRSGGRFDAIGAVGFGVGLVGILLALAKGTEWGWTSPVTLGLAIGGALVLVGWAFFELRVTDPLIDLRVAARRPVLLTNLTSVTVGFGFFITAAALPVLLEAPSISGVGLGVTLLIASLCLMPSGLVMFFLSPVAARLSASRGPRTSLILGGSIIAAGYALATVLDGEVWHVALIATVVGFGVGFAYAAMPTLIMQSVPSSETASSNGLNSVMRTLGSTFAATLVGVILSSNVTITDGLAIPTSGAFHTVFIMGSIVAAAGVLAAFFIPRENLSYVTSSIPVQPRPSRPLPGT